MTAALEWASALFLLVGAGFFLAGTLGLGFLVLGLALQAETLAAALKLLLIWPLVLLASAAVSYALARRAHALGVRPWTPPGGLPRRMGRPRHEPGPTNTSPPGPGAKPTACCCGRPSPPPPPSSPPDSSPNPPGAA